MNPPHDPWSRLAAAARRAPADVAAVSAPAGFATRVVAQAMSRSRERSLAVLIDRMSWRALGAAALLAVSTVALTLPPILRAIDQEPLGIEDPVVALWDTR
jgi:hypothetical protein